MRGPEPTFPKSSSSYASEARQQWHGAVRVGPKEGHKVGQRAGGPLLRGQVQRARTVEAGEEKAHEYILISSNSSSVL